MNPFVPLEDPGEMRPILSQISLFGGVTVEQQSEIFCRLEAGKVKKGEFVFQKGDEPSHIFIIARGSIGLFIPDQEHRVEKKVLGTGDCFGQVAVLSIHQHTVSALAVEDSELIVLSRGALLQLHQQDVGLFALLMMNIARELARRLQYVDSLLLESAHTHAARQISAH